MGKSLILGCGCQSLRDFGAEPGSVYSSQRSHLGSWRTQIEEALLFGGGGAPDAGNEVQRKRRRQAPTHASEPAVSGDESAWALLCDMYSELGEDHLAQVAQAAHVARCVPAAFTDAGNEMKCASACG